MAKIEIETDGSKRYLNDEGRLHRTDGPAVIRVDGATFWYSNSCMHRIDGPAVRYRDGETRWYWALNQHRVDGPAVDLPSGLKRWRTKGNMIWPEL